MTSELRPLLPQEWETLIDDYNHGGARRLRWTSGNYAAVPLLDLALSSLLRKEIPHNLKLHILVFLEEQFSDFSIDFLDRLVETLRSVIQSPNDGVSTTFSLKEQFLISTTSIFIVYPNDGVLTTSSNVDSSFVTQLESLIELLLTIINRPNHGVDRQTRAIACECLRELETAFPCLLSEIGSHLWSLCQSERTHAGQSYALLLATVVCGIVRLKPNNVSFSNATSPLIPFSVPRVLIDDDCRDGNRELSDLSNRELRRVISFLLEWPQNLTPWGLLEFMDKTLPVCAAIDLQASLLKVQFSGLLHTCDPLLWHAYLVMYLRFMDSFEGQELEIASRLLLLSKESQHHLFFRLLVLHWLIGFMGLLLKRDVEKKRNIIGMSLSFYPSVFDPLALKSLKLDLLAYCSVLIDNANGVISAKVNPQMSMEKLFEDGLVCVSSFKWLPPWSMETAVAFRAIHKFLIGQSSHSENGSISNKILAEPTIFHTVQRTLINSLSEYKGMVPVIVALTDRLLACRKHRWLGECLLKTFDQNLLPKLKIDYKLVSYFSILERIAKSDKVSPSGLMELLTRFMVVLVEKHGPDTGLRSWGHGSKVLGICRTLIMHHKSSKLFIGLSHLLAFTCLYFPDLEVRDNARIYLRMLICVPGKKLRGILSSGDQLPGISASTHSSSFFSVQSPRISHDPKKSRNISSYMHLDRMVPLLVKQSWSLYLSSLGVEFIKPSYIETTKDNGSPSEQSEFDKTTDITAISEGKRHNQPREPLRVMDSKISHIVGILRKHFSFIPDFKHMPGLKIKIPCALRFESEPFSSIWGINMPANGVDALPALYATVLKFSSSAPYGSIPSSHIPFLLGQPPKSFYSFSQTNSLDIIPVENISEPSEDDKSFKAPVMIELEPQDPVPGLIEVLIEANADNGQIIIGQLHNISVGIEDMFLKAIIPEDIHEDAVPGYTLDLFNALWEACGASASTGRETFVLKGGKGVAAISGTRSVKLVEVPVASLILAVERSLASFVVSVTGEPLTSLVREGGVIRDIAWNDVSSSYTDDNTSESSLVGGPLYLKYKDDEDEGGGYLQNIKRNLGSIQILIFLPPRFHLLFQMEVSDTSTLVRIRTDHWPCLAYVDDYLEALFCE